MLKRTEKQNKKTKQRNTPHHYGLGKEDIPGTGNVHLNGVVCEDVISWWYGEGLVGGQR